MTSGESVPKFHNCSTKQEIFHTGHVFSPTGITVWFGWRSDRTCMRRASRRTVYTYILILHSFGFICNINKKLKRKIQASRRVINSYTFFHIIIIIIISQWILLTMTCSIHIWAQSDFRQTLYEEANGVKTVWYQGHLIRTFVFTHPYSLSTGNSICVKGALKGEQFHWAFLILQHTQDGSFPCQYTEGQFLQE